MNQIKRVPIPAVAYAVCRELLHENVIPTLSREKFLDLYRRRTGDTLRSDGGILSIARKAIAPRRLPPGYQRSERGMGEYLWTVEEDLALLRAYEENTEGLSTIVPTYRALMPGSRRTDGAIEERLSEVRKIYNLPVKKGFHRLKGSPRVRKTPQRVTTAVPKAGALDGVAQYLRDREQRSRQDATAGAPTRATAPDSPAVREIVPRTAAPQPSVEKLFNAYLDGVISEEEFKEKVKGR